MTTSQKGHVKSGRISLIPIERIERAIIVVRGEKVMLDSELAELYGVETKALNQAVKRNASRFPSDFMFQLTKDELANLKSQIVTSSWGGVHKLGSEVYGDRDMLPRDVISRKLNLLNAECYFCKNTLFNRPQ